MMSNDEAEAKFCDMMMGELESRGPIIESDEEECLWTGCPISECPCTNCEERGVSYNA